MFSFLFLQERYSKQVLFSLLFIIGGVTLCTFAEKNFEIWALSITLIATAVFVLQNIYSKLLFRKFQLHPVVLSFYISFAALLINLPLFLFFPLPEIKVTGTDQGETGFPMAVMWLSLASGVAHWAQNILALHLVERVSTLTYAIAGTFKRVFVIVTSILYFGNPVSLMNGVGAAIAFTGLFFYDRFSKQQQQQRSTSRKTSGRRRAPRKVNLSPGHQSTNSPDTVGERLVVDV